MNATTYRVSGSIAGGLWWPQGEPAFKSFEYTTRERPADLRELAESICDSEGGDFSTAPRFLADCVLTVTRWRQRGHVSRSWPLTSLRSLAAYTSDTWPEWSE